MLIKGENITSTSRLLKIAREGKMTIIVKGKLMYLTMKNIYKKVRWLGDKLTKIEGDIAVYRIDTFNSNEVKRVNYYLKKHDSKIIYNSLGNPNNVLELK